MIWPFAILFSIRIREFSFNMTNSCVTIKKLNVAILKSGVKFKWSSSVPGQWIYQHFGNILQGFSIKLLVMSFFSDITIDISMWVKTTFQFLFQMDIILVSKHASQLKQSHLFRLFLRISTPMNKYFHSKFKTQTLLTVMK